MRGSVGSLVGFQDLNFVVWAVFWRGYSMLCQIWGRGGGVTESMKKDHEQ